MRMPDGTVKQLNPFTGTEVWTVPGRGHRPLVQEPPVSRKLAPGEAGNLCAFCEERYAQTPPEKARVLRDGDEWITLTGINALERESTVAEFRRIPNLFEIVSYDYWHGNYGYEPPAHVIEHRDRYIATGAGKRHVDAVVRQRMLAQGKSAAEFERLTPAQRVDAATGFFAGGHDVIVARRHVIDGAERDDQLASSGTLTPGEHFRFCELTSQTMADLYGNIRYARYVSAFQNWLKPAGASFDHLHKQVVAIDSHSVQTELEAQRLRANLNAYNEFAVDYAARQNLIVAENDYAVAFAGFGHRYPSLEVFSKSERTRPWEHAEEERRGVSDLLHALHAATGPLVPCNEEWHHQPPDLDLPMPWRIVLKWRVSTIAGFEGGTKIYLNTLDPWTIRDRVVSRLYELRDEGAVADGLRIAMECQCRPNSLRYNPLLHAGPPDASPVAPAGPGRAAHSQSTRPASQA